MFKIIINGQELIVHGGSTILAAARENKIEISTLCYLNDCIIGESKIRECNICVVEIENEGRLVNSCNTLVTDGMIINTNSDVVRDSISKTLSKMLDSHQFKCGTCRRKEDCELFKLVIKYRARASKPFIVKNPGEFLDERSQVIAIDRSKCIKCGRCEQACIDKTGTEMIKLQELDGETLIGANEFNCLDDTNCLLCGQCIEVCPVDALYDKSHIEIVEEALNDPSKNVIVAMAPAVRTSIGELFKMGYGVDVTGKLYTALREIGFDKVFDINFGADFTIVEEAIEFVGRTKSDGRFPMFTSCCPSWVRQVENYFPDYLENLSTTKSPQAIFGAATKTYYPEAEGIDPKSVFTVTIMPCTSKKFEANRDEMQNDGTRNIDAVLTTRELARIIKQRKIKFAELEDGVQDSMMGLYSGAGAIFGRTGGVMEAVMRTAKAISGDDNIEKIEYTGLNDIEGVKEGIVKIGGSEYKVAVVNGAKNLFEFLNSGHIKSKEYHFIEVMACPGGCINGGGQPHVTQDDQYKYDIKALRTKVLNNQDDNLKYKRANDNESIKKMYDLYVNNLEAEKRDELFHQKYINKSLN